MPASVESGVDYDAAKTLAEKAHIEEVLQCTKLGGKREWKLADFLDEEVWEELGGKAGLREQAIEFLTLIAAGGRTPPIDPVCQECGVFKFVHTGDRLTDPPGLQVRHRLGRRRRPFQRQPQARARGAARTRAEL